jgi:hypothetical protein
LTRNDSLPVQCTLNTVHCKLYTVKGTLYTVHYTLYTIDCKLDTGTYQDPSTTRIVCDLPAREGSQGSDWFNLILKVG